MNFGTEARQFAHPKNGLARLVEVHLVEFVDADRCKGRCRGRRRRRRWRSDITDVIQMIHFVVVDRLLSNNDLLCGSVQQAVPVQICTRIVDEGVCWEPQLLEFMASGRIEHATFHCLRIVAVAYRSSGRRYPGRKIRWERRRTRRRRNRWRRWSGRRRRGLKEAFGYGSIDCKEPPLVRDRPKDVCVDKLPVHNDMVGGMDRNRCGHIGALRRGNRLQGVDGVASKHGRRGGVVGAPDDRNHLPGDVRCQNGRRAASTIEDANEEAIVHLGRAGWRWGKWWGAWRRRCRW